MANIRGYFDPAYSGFTSQKLGDGIVYAGRSTNFDVPPQWTFETLAHDDFAEILAEKYAAGVKKAGAPASTPVALRATEISSPHDDWFELVHVLPRSIDLGLITADQSIPLEVYNAYRVTPRVFSAFSSGAGEGVTITDLPALPATIQEQDSLFLNLEVLVAVGPPVVDSTLDFVFDVVTILIPIELERAVMFPFEPVAPVIERLGFLTDVIDKRNGKEQRTSLRVSPRQSFDVTYQLDGFARRLFESIVFDAQARPLGIPVWFEPALLTAQVTAGAMSLPVDSTDFADHRVGSFVMLFQSESSFEVHTTASIGPTSIGIGAPLVGTFPVGTRVMPVRIAFASANWRGTKAPVNLQSTRVTFDVLDNEVDLSSAAAFGSFGGKVLLDEPNEIQGSLSESWERTLGTVDNLTGLFVVTSDMEVSRRAHLKTFRSRSRQRLWQVRQLLHFLRGRQTSFYIPTFYEELVPVANVTGGTNTVDVENVGYAKFVKSRQARNVVQLIKTDGTKLTPVTITAASELSTTVERLTVSPNWSGSATVAEVKRVEYFEKVRMDTDEVQIEHSTAIGDAEVEMPVRSVLE